MMENQPAYGQEDEIDLVALTFTLLRKYRQILAAALACAIIFGAAAGAHTAWGGAVSQDAQKAYESELAEYNRKKESYEAAKQQYSLDIANNEKSQRDTEYAIQKAQEYAENSVWNNLDPYNVWVAQADLYVTTNYQIQPGMAYQNPDRTDSVLSAYASLLGNSSTLSEVAQQFNMQERYLRELVTISSDPDTHLLAITVMSSSEQTSSNILTALLEQVNAMNANITASVGSHTISVIAQSSYSTVSTDLRDAQTENGQNLLSLQTQIDQLQQSRTRLDSNFEDTTKEWESTEEPVLQSTRISSAVLKFGLIGLLVGIVLVCGAGTVQFLVQGKVYSGKELRDTCRLPLLGTLASGKTRQSKQLDAALDRMEHRPDGSTDAEMIRLMAATIASRAPEAKHILITGDLPADQLTALAAALQDTDALRAQVEDVEGSKNELTRMISNLCGQMREIFSDKVSTTVIDENKPARNADHPTMKPLKLLARLIKNSSRQGDIVLDTFGGSGSTLIACEQLGRSCYTMELDPKYADVIVKRWLKFTGADHAELVRGGKKQPVTANML